MSTTKRLLVGVIHLPPLPGTPRFSLPMREIVASCAADVTTLHGAGYDLVIIENFGDAPFFPGRVPAVTVSAMTACIVHAQRECPGVRIGVNVLRNDADAALAIAAVTNAAVIRVNVHTAARVTDQGVIEGRAAETLRTRRALGAAAEIWADVDVKHSAPLAARAPADEAKDLVVRGLADAVLVTGEGTGRPVDLAKLAAIRAAIPATPILVASGATMDALTALSEHATGVIVGTALRADGQPGGPIDPSRATEFAAAFRAAFGE